MLERLMQWMSGYVIVELCGMYPERFLNLCKNRNIVISKLYDVQKECFCEIRLRDYRQLRQIARKSHCIPKIKKRTGAPFLVKKAVKRKGFVIGLALSLWLAWQCSLRIWNIEIEGGFLHTKEQMMDYLAEQQIVAGMKAENIDCFELEKQIRLKFSDIGWVSAEIRGTNLCVHLNESVMPRKTQVQTGTYHIIAKEDGIVRKVSVISGVPMVKAGDTVKAGDILISGVLPIIGDNELLLRKQPLAAQGEVLLEVQFSYAADYEMYYTKRIPIKQKKGFSLSLFGTKLISYIPRYSTEKYAIMTNDMEPFYFEEFSFPLRIREYQCFVFEESRQRYTKEEITAIAEADLNRFLSDWEKQQVSILNREISYQVGQKQCNARGTITALGNFISYQEIQEEEWRTESEHEYSGDNP